MKRSARYHPAYATWAGMIARCYRPYATGYKNYGGRGITVCARWRGSCGFWNFVEDMWPKPNDYLTLDRINNDLGYSLDNCRWASKTEQTRNKRDIHWITVNDELLPLATWAKRYGISRKLIRTRISKGISPELAVTLPKTK